VSAFTEVRNLASRLFAEDGGGEPRDFAALLQLLLSMTVLDEGIAISHVRSQPDDDYIGGRRRQPLRLNNGKYLKFFMYFRKDQKQPLTVTQSCLQYQATDEAGYTDDFIFRYDYNIDPDEAHPMSHLQIAGELQRKDVTDKALKDIRFPVARPSIESLLTLLINDFGIVPNDREWQEALQYSEAELMHYRARQLVKARGG